MQKQKPIRKVIVFASILAIMILLIPQASATTWQKQTVDNKDSSLGNIIFDQTKKWIHIAYRNSDGIIYAKYDGNSWNKEIFDSADGSFAIAIDKNSNPHIVYDKNEMIYYATKRNGVWSFQAIDNGHARSIAVDSNNNPHILYGYIYKNNVGPITTYSSLKYAKWNGNSWQIITIDKLTGDISGVSRASLALDSMNRPHVSYCNGDIGGQARGGTLWYATSVNGNVWTKQIVEKRASGSFTPSIIVGTDNIVRIAYYSHGLGGVNGQLFFAQKIGTSWVRQIIESTLGETSGKPSIALDSTNKAHISYYDMKNYDLKYAKQTGTNSWSKEIVEDKGDSFQSIAVDKSNNRVYIAYRYYDAYDNTKNCLKLAKSV